jgi:hypothetical protein
LPAITPRTTSKSYSRIVSSSTSLIEVNERLMFGPDKLLRLERPAMTPDSLRQLIDHHRGVAQHHQQSYDTVAAEFASPPGIEPDSPVMARFRFAGWANKNPVRARMLEHDLRMAAIHRETADALQ